MDLIVTSGGLGPTADDLTAQVVGTFAGREMVLDEGMEEKIAKILAGFARRLNFDAEALREANRKQAVVPEGSTLIDPAGTAPGLVVPVDGGPVVIVMPGPPRELHAMWPKALETDPVREVLDRAEPYAGVMLRLFGIPESEIAKTLREIEEGGVAIDELEITTCLRKGELEIEVRHRPGAEDTLAELIAGIDERHGRFLFSRDGETIDSQLADASRRPPDRDRRVVHRRPPRGAPDRARRRLRLRHGRRGHLHERVEDEGARRSGRVDRRARRGLAGGRRGDG